LAFITPRFLEPQAACISVPVFLSYGDADVLAEPTREQLWDRLIEWSAG